MVEVRGEKSGGEIFMGVNYPRGENIEGGEYFSNFGVKNPGVS